MTQDTIDDPEIREMLGLPPLPQEDDSGDESRLSVEERRRRRLRELSTQEPVSFHMSDMARGVTTSWLAQVFNMDPATVKKKLAECPPLHRRKAGYVYDLATAAPFLVKPRFDVNEYLRNMRPTDLPSALQKEYWQALRERQKYEEEAGDLWRSTAVLEVFAKTFQTIKTTMQLWVMTLDRSEHLSDDARGKLTEMVDQLQDEIHRALVETAGKSSTQSTRSEVVVEETDVLSNP